MRNWRGKAGASLVALVVTVMMAGPVRAITTHHPSDADAGEYPYAVALVDAGADSYDGQFCGGSVIGDRWILTAAHCVTTEDGRAIDPSAIEAVIGRTDLTSSDGERIVAVGVAVHPDYDPWMTSYDLAVIELATATTASSVALPSAGEGSEGTAAVVVGWGEDSDGEYPTDLQETEVTLVGDDDCSDAYDGDFDGSSMLCAGDTQPGGEGDSCYGDSGGPLVVSTSEGPVVVGVVSWGYECDGAYPGVYAEVGAETEWIGSVLSGETPTETDGADPEDDSEDAWFDEDFEDDGWFEDEWLDEDLTDAEIAEIQAEDAAIIAALEAAGIDFTVESDEIGDFPVFDESDPDAWAVVDAVLEDLYG